MRLLKSMRRRTDGCTKPRCRERLTTISPKVAADASRQWVCEPTLGVRMRKLFAPVLVAALFATVPSAVAAVQLVPAYFYPSGRPHPWHTMCNHMNSEGYGSTAIC